MTDRRLKTGWMLLVVLHASASSADAQTVTVPLDVARTMATVYPTSAGSLSYVQAVSWSGSFRLAELAGEDRWRDDALEAVRPFIEGETPPTAEPYRLSNLAGAAVIVDVALDGNAAAAAVARQTAELLLPTGPDDPVRYATGWTDDMFMAASLLARVGALTGDQRYAEVVGLLLTTYAERLQRPDGLFGHAADAPFAWGRGNGFAAMGLVEALTFLPEDWSYRVHVTEIYRRQMSSLATHQSEDGSWHQVVDVPTSYRELTVTAMSITAMARGVRLGLLGREEFEPVITRGWAAVAARVAADGSVRDACASTAAGTTLEYYLERPVVNALDDRAGGLVLLAALEIEELARGR